MTRTARRPGGGEGGFGVTVIEVGTACPDVVKRRGREDEDVERVVLGRRENSMVRFRWSGAEPENLNDVDLAEEYGAVWEGDELVTYDMESLVWQMEHLSDPYMIDND